MIVKIEQFGYLCELKIFEINDIDAIWEDFGDKFDDDPKNAREYRCGNMKFHPKNPTKEILEKYKITEKEYWEICGELDGRLSFGSCGWCE